MKSTNRTLVVFRRDLRLSDNTALVNAALKKSEILPCFIIDPRQIKQNEYASKKAICFMAQALLSLENLIKKEKGNLFIFKGEAESVVEKILKKHEIDHVFISRDYTPFSMLRDNKIKKVCDKKEVDCQFFQDVLLTEPEEVHKDNGKPYTIFSYFFKKASMLPVRKPENPSNLRFFSRKIDDDVGLAPLQSIIDSTPYKAFLSGTHNKALGLLKNIENLKDYETTHDIPSTNKTSLLSSYLKFGLLSIRNIYWKIVEFHGITHPLIRQLYWRDFFTHIAFHFPHVFQGAFHKKYDALSWDNDKLLFEKWCQGKTGFPLVDAGMRQLNKTGFMHNRVRMIVASFLVKDLHIDWRWGEKYFATNLVDYDPCLNNGNWQWAASTGCDAQPYFRVFNPWRQQQRFDPDCLYIKEWVEELRGLSAKEIHNVEKNKASKISYYEAVVDHKTESEKSKTLYKLVKS